MTTITLPTRRGLLGRIRRALQLALLRWHLDCVRDELRRYVATGHAGPIFARESLAQQRRLMAAIRALELS